MHVLDLCCGLGGATRGYQRAGFRVTGVDIVEQPDYCGDDFYVGDALAFLVAHGREFDFIHTSFPCQASCTTTKGNRVRGMVDDHIDLNPSGRALLDAVGVPYVMENVVGSVLRRDLILCGLRFGLKVFRHRYFEFGMMVPPVVEHLSHDGHRVRGWRHGSYYDGDMYAVYGAGGGKATIAECREGLGIDWSRDKKQLVEAIPPAYTEYIAYHIPLAVN